MSVRHSWLVLASFLLLTGVTTSAQADNPVEWLIRTNGLGWGEGYHANNGCVKTGALPRSYIPTSAGYQATWNAYPSPAVQYQPNFHPALPANVPRHSPAYPSLQPAPGSQQPIEDLPSVRKQLPPVPDMRPSPQARYYPQYPQYPQGQMGPRLNAPPLPYAGERSTARLSAVRP